MAGIGMRLGRIFGIEIRLDRSWFIIFFLIAWTLATYQLPRSYPNWTAFAYWWIGLLSGTLFFASVMAHELGHSLVARRLGIPVQDITLFLFGGAARLGREPRRARDELLIALAGPAMSLGLALLFGTLLGVSSGGAEPYLAMVGWLAAANLLLALFNLSPGFPLDGGRVVRALVWGVTGNLHRATQAAANLGRVVALAFIFWGFWQAAGGNWVGGIWLVLIGWFLSSSAIQASRHAAIEDLSAGMVVRDVMAGSPELHPWLTLDVAAEQVVLPSGRRGFPIVEGTQWRGLLTLQRIKSVPRQDWATTRVMHVMIERAAVHTAAPEDALAPVMQRMILAGVEHAAVVEHGHLVGLLDRDMVVHTLRVRAKAGAHLDATPGRDECQTPESGAKIA